MGRNVLHLLGAWCCSNLCMRPNVCYRDSTRQDDGINFTMCLGDGAGDTKCDDNFPQSYGTTCAAWDRPLYPCDGSDAGFCGEPWCFVDQDVCGVSDVHYARSSYLAGKWYSYETCGGDERMWEPEEMSITSLRGKTLRAAVPELGSPFCYVVDPETSEEVVSWYAPGVMLADRRIPNLRGTSVDVMTEVCARGGCVVEFYPTSEASLSSEASPYDACVLDVLNGRADVCVGSLWTTEKRLRLTTFTIALRADEFVLLVPRGTAWNDRSCFLSKSRLECTKNRSCRSW